MKHRRQRSIGPSRVALGLLVDELIQLRIHGGLMDLLIRRLRLPSILALKCQKYHGFIGLKADII